MDPQNLHVLPEEKDHKVNLNLENIEESKSKKKNQSSLIKKLF